MDPKDEEVIGEPKLTTTAAASSVNGGTTRPRLSCTKCFDTLWFCYSPFHQMKHYYRYGEYDNCYSKWKAFVDCLSLKTKKESEVAEILEAREKSKPHIWQYRTVEEASVNWWRMYSHFFDIRPKRDA